MKHTVFCICGRSASGKDTIANEISSIIGIPKIVSYTTRPRREGESDNSHIFISQKEYETIKEMQTLCAYTQIGDYHYFTTKEQIEELLTETGSVIYVIDPNGIKTLKESMPNTNIITIFINVPREECKNRAQGRGDSMKAYHDRSIAEHRQFSEMIRSAAYDYAVPNRNLNMACDIISHIIYRESQ